MNGTHKHGVKKVAKEAKKSERTPQERLLNVKTLPKKSKNQVKTFWYKDTKKGIIGMSNSKKIKNSGVEIIPAP